MYSINSGQQSVSGGRSETRSSAFTTATAKSDANKKGSKQMDDTWTNKFSNVSISRILRLLQLILLQLMQTEEERSSFREKARFVQETTNNIGRLAATKTIKHDPQQFVTRLNEEKKQLEVDLASFDKQSVSIQQAEGELRRLEHELKDWLENVEPQIRRADEAGGGRGDKQLYSDKSGVCAKSASTPSHQSIDERLKTYFSLLGDIKIMQEDMNALEDLHLEDQAQREHFKDQGRIPAISDEEFEVTFTARKEKATQNLARAHQRAHSLHDECVGAGLDIEKSRWRKSDHANPVSWDSHGKDSPRASRLEDWLEDLAHPSILGRMSTPHLTEISSSATPDPLTHVDNSPIALAQPVPEAYTVGKDLSHDITGPHGYPGTELGHFEKQIDSSSWMFDPWKPFYPHNVETPASGLEYRIALLNAGYASSVPGISRGATTHEAHAANQSKSAAIHSMPGYPSTWPPATGAYSATNVDAVQHDVRELFPLSQPRKQRYAIAAEMHTGAAKDNAQAGIHIHQDQFAKAVKPAAFFKIGKVC
nr:hypothetical protein CFP56_13405 [Quercus suber]